MNQTIITSISDELNIKKTQTENTLKLLSDGNTVPFIARYRKEVTGNLDEEQIRKINDVYTYQVNLLKRKEDILRLIDEKGMLTDEIKEEINKTTKLVELEDIYRPYKEKKKTKATEAIKNGLEPLANLFLTFPEQINVEEECQHYLNDQVKTLGEAQQGASYIIAEIISDNAEYRKWIRNYTYTNGMLISKKNKKQEDENKIYEMYYEYQEKIKFIKPHRILAINRGEKEKVLNVSIDIDEVYIAKYLENQFIKNKRTCLYNFFQETIKDAYKRLISPSIEREIRAELKEIADEQAINIFGTNLENLLLIPPMKEKVVLGLDPAYRTGCKLAVVDQTSNVLKITVIYPHEPKNLWNESKETIKKIVSEYHVDIIAIGNGTASRESEKLVAETISEIKDRDVKYIIVSEAGASVYSASKLAISEFPTLHVEERSAISIARRLQDPLNELVKIDSKSIGVGQYQHDVNEKQLDEKLDFVVTKAVNNVGVNVNTASPSILKYISGLTKSAIDKIIKYREEKGKIKSRKELLTKKLLNEKVYQQSVGFMRIIDGETILDQTPIHPESYTATITLLNELGCNIEDIGTKELNKQLEALNIDFKAQKLNIDKYTLEDIIKALMQPNRDYRDDYEKPLLKSDILKLEDLKVGMKLQGTIRNVVDFGAFIDIGLKNDGLAHISKLTNKYIKHPSEVVNVGDIVDCYVSEIHLDKHKVSLSLLEPNKEV